MTSVHSNFNFLCGRPPEPDPLRVDVINGWPLRPTHLLLSGRCNLDDPHVGPPGVRVKCGKSTAPTIRLPDHSAVHDVKCGRPHGGGVLVKCGQGVGVKNGSFFADVLYGRPLTGQYVANCRNATMAL